jgi:hypothetical protein
MKQCTLSTKIILKIKRKKLKKDETNKKPNSFPPPQASYYSQMSSDQVRPGLAAKQDLTNFPILRDFGFCNCR